MGEFKRKKSGMFRYKTLTVGVVIALSACTSFKPEALSNAELQQTLRADRDNYMGKVEPLGSVLTLEEAIARAIKYNTDRRLKAMEEAVAEGNLEVGNYDLLPKLVASAGYRNRNNEQVTVIKGTNSPVSVAKQFTTTDLSITWSLLDFGQSYYTAKQNADRVLVAQERKRKALHLLVQDVRTAYWRVVAAQALGDKVREAVKNGEEALADARKAEGERLRNPLEPLRFQRQLLENIRLLESVEQELSTASTELATLTSLPLGQAIKVAAPSVDLQKAWLDVPVVKLEEHTLIRNADLREGVYNGRIAREETRRAMLKMFPGISFNYGTKSTDDTYQLNKHWTEAGAQVSFNLFGFLSAPAQMRLADAGVALADQKRLVTQMAVLSQLHVARLQFANALRQYERADDIAGVETRIAEHVANQAEAEKQTKLDKVSQQTSLILAQLRRFQALSNAQAAASKLQATLGLEPVVEATGQDSLSDLTKAVGKALKVWSSAAMMATPLAAEPDSAAERHRSDAPIAAESSMVASGVKDEALAGSPEQEAVSFVYKWVEAWRDKKFINHFECYSSTFKPEDQRSFKAFQKHRIARATNAKSYDVVVINPRVEIQSTGSALVSFEQHISAKGFRYGSMKQLVLDHENGHWKIRQETTVGKLKQER